MNNFVNFGDYLNLSGTETFNAKLSIDNNASLELSSNLSNTTFSSYIDELNKRPSDNLLFIVGRLFHFSCHLSDHTTFLSLASSMKSSLAIAVMIRLI